MEVKVTLRNLYTIIWSWEQRLGIGGTKSVKKICAISHSQKVVRFSETP